VSYLQNGALARVVNVAANLTFFFDSSFNGVGSALSNIRFGPLSNLASVTPGSGNLYSVRRIRGRRWVE
jgi:hypothetical protein